MGGHKRFSHIWKGATKIFYKFEGAVKIFTLTEHFNPFQQL